MAWDKELRELKNGGGEVVEVTSTYHPGGYPKIGLAPLKTKLSSRSGDRIKAQMEKAERARGNTRFRATGLGTMDPRLASELAGVYLGLAERFPGVRVDRINFCANVSALGPVVIAAAGPVGQELPGLREAAYLLGEADIRQVIANLHVLDEETAEAASKDARFDVRHYYSRDFTAHGGIDLGECLSHPRCYGVLQGYWQMKSAQRIARGEHPRNWPSRVSVASQLLIHEFGHVVEFALLGMGGDAHEKVLEALEGCLLKDEDGRWLASDYQLRKHGLKRSERRLVNYPLLGTPSWGDAAHRKTVKKVVGSGIGDMLGRYATESRTEMFAEAVLYSLAAKDQWRLNRLAPFREALWEAGLMAKRRRG